MSDLTTAQAKAREVLARALGMPSGNAATAVLELDDAETAEIAGVSPSFTGDSCRDAVKAIYGRALERRQANEGAAGEAINAALRLRNACRDVLRRELGLKADAAADAERVLSDEERHQVVELASSGKSAAQIRQIISNLPQSPR